MSTKEINFRPLNKVMSLVDATGHQVTYAFDDLVFIAHSEIIIQFSEKSEKGLNLFIHKDIQEADITKIKELFITKAKEFDLIVSYKGSFEIIEKPGEQNVDIKFYPLSER